MLHCSSAVDLDGSSDVSICPQASFDTNTQKTWKSGPHSIHRKEIITVRASTHSRRKDREDGPCEWLCFNVTHSRMGPIRLYSVLHNHHQPTESIRKLDVDYKEHPRN